MRLLSSDLSMYAPPRRTWEWWKIQEPALAGLPDFVSLVAEVQNPATSLAREDARLAALVRIARTDNPALMALLIVLGPRLRAKVRRFAAALDREEAEAEIIAGLVDRVRSYDLERRPTAVAANILWDATRPLRRARDRQRQWTDRTVALRGTDTANPHHSGTGAVELAEDTILDMARAAGVLTATDAALIVATRLRGFSLADASRLAGWGYEAAKKRRQRAEAALSAWWTSDQPRFDPAA